MVFLVRQRAPGEHREQGLVHFLYRVAKSNVLCDMNIDIKQRRGERHKTRRRACALAASGNLVYFQIQRTAHCGVSYYSSSLFACSRFTSWPNRNESYLVKHKKYLHSLVPDSFQSRWHGTTIWTGINLTINLVWLTSELQSTLIGIPPTPTKQLRATCHAPFLEQIRRSNHDRQTRFLPNEFDFLKPLFHGDRGQAPFVDYSAELGLLGTKICISLKDEEWDESQK